MTLQADEFLRRFLLHILPSGFMRLRHYGLLANRYRKQKIAQCRALLDQPDPPKQDKEDAADLLKRLARIFHEFVPRSRRILVSQGNSRRNGVSVITPD